MKIYCCTTGGGVFTYATTDPKKAEAFEYEYRGSDPETFEADLDLTMTVEAAKAFSPEDQDGVTVRLNGALILNLEIPRGHVIGDAPVTAYPEEEGAMSDFYGDPLEVKL
jgi:hypothetical protein